MCWLDCREHKRDTVARPTDACKILAPDDVATSIRDLVGREAELAGLQSLLEPCGDSLAAAVVVGEAGIGKTALALAATEMARAHGYLVLSCRTSETEAGFSFAGLGDLIGGVVSDVIPRLPRPQQHALNAALGLWGSGGAPANEGVVAFAFLSALRMLATRNKLLIAVDDVQWLDPASLAILRFALARLDKLQVTAVLTVRDEVPHWLRQTLPEERLLVIELGPLSLGALREMLRVRLGAVLPRPTLLRISETSGGNPLYALELARALQRRGGITDPGSGLAVPRNLEVLVRERLDRLGADGLEVSQIVAALARPTLGLVKAVAGDRGEIGLSAAVDGGVLELDGDRLRFVHPLLRSAVYSRVGGVKRQSLHGRLARLVTDREEQARHLALATSQPDRQVAHVVEAAAEDAHRRGAILAAVELAELAIKLTPPLDGDDLRRRVLACADISRDSGDGQRAIALLEQAHRTAPPGAARAAVLVRLASVLNDFVGLRNALDRYRAALAEADGDEALQAEIQLNLAELVAATEDRNSALSHAERAVEAASRAGDAALRCRALATYGRLHFRAGLGVAHSQMDEALAIERSLPESSLPTAATWALAYQLVWSGDLERARKLLEELRQKLRAREDPQEHDALWFLSFLEWRAGNWDLGARHAADSLAVRELFGLEGGQPIAALPGALIAAYRGQIEDAGARSELALKAAEAGGIRIAQSGHRAVLGFIELSRGDAETALRYLEPGWEMRDSVGLLEPGHRLELADTLEALIAVGRLEAAESKLIPWEERSRALDRSWAIAITARCRALLHAARGDSAGAVAIFDRALAEHERTQDPFQHARTLLALGVTQRRAKQRGAARLTLEKALAIFDRLGAPLWAEKARAEVRRIGGRGPSRGELTEAELRIASLVAEGRTNREVATALFVTQHTVEAALTRTYQKLGVRSRTALAARLARHASGPDQTG